MDLTGNSNLYYRNHYAVMEPIGLKMILLEQQRIKGGWPGYESNDNGGYWRAGKSGVAGCGRSRFWGRPIIAPHTGCKNQSLGAENANKRELGKTVIYTDLFGKTISCNCGKTHRIEPKTVIYSKDAMEQLPKLRRELRLGNRVAVLSDNRTREVAGRILVRILSEEGLKVSEILVPDGPNGNWPICDDVTEQFIDRRMGEVDWILAVGSGVINDLGKWLAGDREIPYISFATAASMNGYTSANVAPTIKGMKSLAFAQPPVAVLSSPEIICSAPYPMTTAGLGDVLAKTISTTDWYLNHLLFGDHFCEKSAGLITEIESLYLHRSREFRKPRPETVDALFQALLLTGVSMTMAGTSSPASGGEHLVSHALDMMSSIDGGPHDLHGRQVGLETILMAALYERVLAVESPSFGKPTQEVDAPFWGPLGEVVKKNYLQKTDRLLMAKEKLGRGDLWDRLREALAPMLHSPQLLHRCLYLAGAATKAGDIGCSRDRLLDALLHAHEIRSRFTVLDVAYLIGIMPSVAEELVDGIGVD